MYASKCCALFYIESKIFSFFFAEIKVAEARPAIQLGKGEADIHKDSFFM